ncbi:MAG: glycosyltransferase family 1 protein [Nitrospirae bacterium]|nr:glycosyltransferase family 1 protein [Nitrospirota bacterium]
MDINIQRAVSASSNYAIIPRTMNIGLQTWGSEGDIRPFIALAAGLVQAGHQVALVVADNAGRDYSGFARRYGFTLHTVSNPLSAEPVEIDAVWRALISAGNPLKQLRMILKYGFDPIMEEMYTAARHLCVGKDLVVGHFFVFPLRVAAEMAGVPVATVSTVYNCIPSSAVCPSGFPDIGRWSYPLEWKIARMILNHVFLPRVNALRIREGLSPDKDVMADTWAAEKLNLIAVSKRIWQRPADWDGRHQVCGFLNLPGESNFEELPKGLEAFLASGPAPIYITFGSMMPDSLPYIRETVSLVAAAIKLVGCRAILQISWGDLSLFETDPLIFKVVRTAHSKVFPLCRAIVHHGGAGTTQSSLLAGKPSVVVAHIADQRFWGAELRRLGVTGVTLTRNSLSSIKLAREINNVLNDTAMAKRASSIGQELSREDGVSEAVRLIEKIFPQNAYTGLL